MSIETWYFPEKCTKTQLFDFLKSLGFRTSKTNMIWCGPEGTQHFYWFQEEDFMSTTGIDASLFPLDLESKKLWDTKATWGLRTRTSISASSLDQEQQNNVMRSARRLFGGFFINDYYGRNRYNKIPKWKTSPVGRGIARTYYEVFDALDRLEQTIPEEIVKSLVSGGEKFDSNNDPYGLWKAAQMMEPNRVLYNAIVPFIVASLEHFFSQVFQIMLKYDEKARKKLEDSKRKIPLDEVLQISRGERQLESVVADWFSFQNLDSIHSAFNEYYGIDVWKILRKRKRIRDKLPLLNEELKKLIQFRHGLVHHFQLDLAMDRNGLLGLLELAKLIIQMFVEEIEIRLGIEVKSGGLTNHR